MKNENFIILFDGVCNLCNGIVMFIIKRDKKAKFKFASIQSAIGQKLFEKHRISKDEIDSFIFINNDNYIVKSTAGLYLLKELGGIWKLFYIFIIIPRPIRDFVYNIIANTRYKFFGKRDKCMVPTDDLKDMFFE